MGVVPQHDELGRAAAMIVHRHLGGQHPDMPVLSDQEPN
jgi:hypothetical protein